MMRHTIIALAASIAAIGSTPVNAEGAVKGSLALPSGIPVQDYPVIISGKGDAGKRRFVTTTREDGSFELDGLPAGEYEARPANEPLASQSFEIEDKDAGFFEFWNTHQNTVTKDIGTLKVEPGSKF